MFRALMFREIVRVGEQEKFMMHKNGERDYMVPISIIRESRDRCKSLQTARDRAMSLTFHLVTRSSKPKPLYNINLSSRTSAILHRKCLILRENIREDINILL